MTDAYRDVSYDITSEADFVASEESDLLVRRLTRGIEHHLFAMNAFRESFSDENWEAYFSLVIEGIVRPWEKLILGPSASTSTTDGRFTFTELGALRFDKDWRTLSSFLSGFTTSGEVRDKFARLQQIAYVLSLDDEEEATDGLNAGETSIVSDSKPDRAIYDQASQAGFSWRLSAIEVTAVRKLRISNRIPRHDSAL